MKKILLVLFLGVSVVKINAQSCTPGANYADSTYGVWPDTTTNFPFATVGMLYSTDLNFKVPSTITADLDPSGAFVGQTISSFSVDNVQGLPTGFNYACNVSSCSYPGGSNGCANVYGTTALTGTFNITINVTVNIPAPIIGTIPYATSFSGYTIVVGNAGIESASISTFRITPNPVNDYLNVSNIQNALNVSTLQIFSCSGQLLKTFNVNGSLIEEIDVRDIPKGMYLLNIKHAQGNDVLRFTKE
jgi:hypothetical protein